MEYKITTITSLTNREYGKGQVHWVNEFGKTMTRTYIKGTSDLNEIKKENNLTKRVRDLS